MNESNQGQPQGSPTPQSRNNRPPQNGGRPQGGNNNNRNRGPSQKYYPLF